MKRLWEQYLNQFLDLDNITQLVVYTDSYRFWLTNGLLDLADQLDIPANLQLIEEITDEEGMEIKQSLAYLPDSTLLASFFSNRNPVIEELNTIFPLLTPPFGFSGYSLIIHQNLPDQFYPGLLQTDLFLASELEEEYRHLLKSGLNILEFSCEGGTFFEAEIVSVASFPYMPKNRHVLLPGTELILNIKPSSINGVVVVTESMGSYTEEGELLDPFGRLDEPLEILIEKGKIMDLKGNDLIIRRLGQLIELPYTTDTIQLSIGLGPRDNATGFIEYDRLIRNFGTISWISDDMTYLEFVIGEIDLLTNNR